MLHRATRLQSWISFLLLTSLAQAQDSCSILLEVVQETAPRCDFEVSCGKLESLGEGAPRAEPSSGPAQRAAAFFVVIPIIFEEVA